MTPSGNLASSSTTTSPNFDTLSSLAGGVGTRTAEQMAPSEASPADSAMQQIGGALQNFLSVTESYPGIGEDKKQQIATLMMEYTQEVISSLNSSPSAQMPASGGFSATSPMGGY